MFGLILACWRTAWMHHHYHYYSHQWTLAVHSWITQCCMHLSISVRTLDTLEHTPPTSSTCAPLECGDHREQLESGAVKVWAHTIMLVSQVYTSCVLVWGLLGRCIVVVVSAPVTGFDNTHHNQHPQAQHTRRSMKTGQFITNTCFPRIVIKGVVNNYSQGGGGKCSKRINKIVASNAQKNFVDHPQICEQFSCPPYCAAMP